MRARRSPPASFEGLYRAELDSITAFFARRSRDPMTVADLTADTFLEALRSYRTFDPARGHARPWLYGIARNVYARRRQRDARLDEAEARAGGRRALEDEVVEELIERIDAQRAGRELLQRLGRHATDRARSGGASRSRGTQPEGSRACSGRELRNASRPVVARPCAAAPPRRSRCLASKTGSGTSCCSSRRGSRRSIGRDWRGWRAEPRRSLSRQWWTARRMLALAAIAAAALWRRIRARRRPRRPAHQPGPVGRRQARAARARHRSRTSGAPWDPEARKDGGRRVAAMGRVRGHTQSHGGQRGEPVAVKACDGLQRRRRVADPG